MLKINVCIQERHNALVVQRGLNDEVDRVIRPVIDDAL